MVMRKTGPVMVFITKITITCFSCVAARIARSLALGFHDVKSHPEWLTFPPEPTSQWILAVAQRIGNAGHWQANHRDVSPLDACPAAT